MRAPGGPLRVHTRGRGGSVWVTNPVWGASRTSWRGAGRDVTGAVSHIEGAENDHIFYNYNTPRNRERQPQYDDDERRRWRRLGASD